MTTFPPHPDLESAPTILRWTRFDSNGHGTGPEKRSAQIRELVERAGFNVRDMVPPRTVPFWRRQSEGIAARLRCGRNPSVDQANTGLLGFRASFYRRAITDHTSVRLLLWETTYDDVLPAQAKAAGFRVIALPHNLESLVSEHAFADPKHDAIAQLSAEIRRLGRADVIFTISREERWLLETRHLTPGYLPFYPSRQLEAECLSIRARREAQAGSNGFVRGPILILGSAFNPATARGMRRQLQGIAESRANTAEIIVAGGNTDRCLGEFARPGVTVLGRIERAMLVHLLSTASVLLVHTEGGAGAVTRIPEALLSGLPVVANANGARDQFGNPGVHVYETAAEFVSLVQAELAIPPRPHRPVAAEFQFIRTVQRCASQVFP